MGLRHRNTAKLNECVLKTTYFVIIIKKTVYVVLSSQYTGNTYHIEIKTNWKKEISIEMKETLLEHNSQVSLRGCSIGDVEILNTNY